MRCKTLIEHPTTELRIRRIHYASTETHIVSRLVALARCDAHTVRVTVVVRHTLAFQDGSQDVTLEGSLDLRETLAKPDAYQVDTLLATYNSTLAESRVLDSIADLKRILDRNRLIH
jgi:hypothetical protein